MLPPYLQNTEQRLEKAVKSENQREDLQDVFLELTTLLMGKMAYNVCDIKLMEDRPPAAGAFTTMTNFTACISDFVDGHTNFIAVFKII